ncbi:DUF4349 domain-containing protein [Sinosporangium siamense]|uniref:Lipoprotein n=1 Tax=Sinosporangium siamense TaxID=1367973 RepID=A0A919RDT3_9ACTN|nr:DUF4349 domain-containing protein [Sinosporangium siamense]GII92038.1 lipoprotein [Sinosporangium siamense]
MKRLRFGLTALLAVVALSSCGGGYENTLNSGGSGEAEHAAVSAQDSGTAPKQEAAPGEAYSGNARNVTTPTAQGGAPAKLSAEPRSIIYTASLSVRVRDVPAAADKAKQIVSAAGGHLVREESNSYSRQTAELAFKVPPAAYQATLNTLGTAVGERRSLTQNSEDVTEVMADVDSRLKSARSAIDSLRTLLGKAETVGDVLKVERELSDRERELESLQARQKALVSQTTMASITLKLSGTETTAPVPLDEPRGFVASIASGWDSLMASGREALAVLGWLIPWLIVIVPAGALLVALRRRVRRRRASRLPAIPVAPPFPAETTTKETAKDPDKGTDEDTDKTERSEDPTPR